MTNQRDPLGVLGLTVAEKYRVERLVGEGGFAVVYRAEHTIWKKPVAIKFFNGLSSAPVDQRDLLQQAFIQEGALLTELSSETAAIVQARDVGVYTTPDGVWMPIMVLEWLEGASLDAVLEEEQRAGKGPWSLPEVLGLLGQAARALDVAHGKGIAHRDVKPANLFVLGEPRSGSTPLKVLDFGVAKMMTDNTELKAALAKTGLGIASFTPQYGAPEQFSRSYGATGPWTDVFALALVAVEMLSGRPGLEGDDLIQLAFSSSNPQARPTPRTLGVSLPDPVEVIFQRALAVRPEERYTRAGEFWRALEAAVASAGGRADLAPTLGVGLAKTELVTSTSPAPGGSRASSTNATAPVSAAIPDTGRRPNRRTLVGGSLAVLVVGGGLFFGLGRDENAPARAPAAKPEASAQIPTPPPPPAPPVVPACPEGMAQIPAGQFFQGSDERDALDNEKPSHNVTLPAFCMDLHEVTAAAYKACSDVGKCKRAGTEVDWPNITARERTLYSPLCTVDDPDKLDHPINCVTWEMADLFCKAQDKRLPSEAEWEYATRGPDGRVYPWGDEPPTAKHLNACGTECAAWGKAHATPLEPLYPEDDGYATTAPVGRFEAGRSRFGPYDVAGNVWEWVADWYGPYTAEEASSPKGPERGEKRVIRGGAWNGSYASWLRPSFRYAQAPTAKSYGIGFRCARDVR